MFLIRNFPGTSVVSLSSEISMGQCNHEEADTRIVIHVRDALDGKAESILIRTVHTVVVILAGKLHDPLGFNENANMWVAFGMGRHFTDLY